jgi:hypothetical protein
MEEGIYERYVGELEHQKERRHHSLPLFTEVPDPDKETLRQRRASTNGYLGEVPTVKVDKKRDSTGFIISNMALGVWNRLALPIIRFFLPRHMLAKDSEGGTEMPRYAEGFRQWWLFYGSAIKRALVCTLVLIALLVAYEYDLHRMIEPIQQPLFKDKAGNPVYNVLMDFSFEPSANSNNSDYWKGMRASMKDSSYWIRDDEIERMFFEAKVDTGRRVEGKNVSLAMLYTVMRNACSIVECRCIAAYHFRIGKRIVLTNVDDEQVFMINPYIVDSSDEKIRVNFHDPNEDHSHLHEKERWTMVPTRITVSFDGLDGQKGRKVLTKKGSACVFRCTQMTE